MKMQGIFQNKELYPSIVFFTISEVHHTRTSNSLENDKGVSYDKGTVLD